MAPTQGNALYYPLIDIPDEGWLLSSLLLWDRVDRIVPKAVTPRDSALVTEIVKAKLLKNAIPDENDRYKSDRRFETWVSRGRDEIGSLRSILQSSPRALSTLVADTQRKNRVSVHKDKMTEQALEGLASLLMEVRENAEKQGMGKLPQLTITRRTDDHGEWLEVPTWAGNLYMCGLATSMAQQRGLEPITNRKPYMGWARFLGDEPMSTAGLLLELKVPWPSSVKMLELANKPKFKGNNGLDRIFKFREKYAAERAAMRAALFAVQGDIRTLDNAGALKDCLNEHRTKVKKSGDAYNKAMRDSLTEVCTAGVVISVPLLALAPLAVTPLVAAGATIMTSYRVLKAADSFRNQRNTAKEKHPWHYASIIEKRLIDY